MTGRATGAKLWALVTIAAALTALTGCGNFFVPPTTGGGGSTTNNRVYVANASTSTIAGFTIGTGTLTAVSGSPFSLGYAPLAAVVTPSNSFLYVAGGGAINVYAINSSTGSLTSANGGAIVNVVALDVSPDGQWLFGLDGASTVVDEYQINTSTGALTLKAQTAYTTANGVAAVPKAIRVAPGGGLVVAALGTGGDVTFSLTTATGVLVAEQTLPTGSTTTSDNAVAIDSAASYLYIARSGTNGGLAVFKINAGGVLNAVSGSPFAAGTGPASVVLDTTGKYVYTANLGDGTISGYSIGTSSALSALNGSPYASGTQVTSLGADKSGKYLLAAAFGGSPDLSMYSFDSTNLGKLNLSTSTSTGTGTNGATAVALTH
jgi:6-phosphogluconolactonase